MKRQWVKAIVLTLTLTGCAMGPDYHKPKLWTPKQWLPQSQRSTGKVSSVPTQQAPDPNWWSVFHDKELTSLEDRLSHQNLDILRAAQTVAVSRGQLLIAGAERFPDLAASGSYSYTQFSTKQMQYILKRVGASAAGTKLGDMLTAEASDATIPLLNRWQDSLRASWEIDLWGRVRRQYEAAKAYMHATREEQRGILIARQAELASDYIALRNMQEQLRITKANRETADSLLKLSESRYKTGLVNRLDVESARSELERTSALIPQQEQRIAMQMNAIALLMGAPPGALDAELQRTSTIPLVPPSPPIGVPSQLAERRPDIREAEEELHAATAEVGQAMADFYPKVVIDSGFGFQALSFRDLGFWNARAWNVGPSITLPIFQGGRLVGQLRMKKAAQRSAALNYRKTVLNAWREVTNALVAYQAEQRRAQRIQSQVAANNRALELAKSRYKCGLQNYLPVLDAQRRVLQSQTELALSTATVADDLVRLYNALGGGWQRTMPK